jgi:oxygen-independent coproporphyrinogen-3 oxidase
MLKMIQDFLPSKGFVPYEISAFSKVGYTSRHNLGYWYGRPFLGFGPSAFSYWNQERFQNPLQLEEYLSRIEQGNFTPAYTEKLSPKAHIAETIAIALRPYAGIDLQEYSLSTEALPKEIQHALASCIQDGLIERETERYTLTKKGRRFYDTVGERLIIV